MAGSRQSDDGRPVVAPGQRFTVQDGRPGEVLGTIRAADADDDRLGNWQVTGGTGADIFMVGALTGQIILADPIPLHQSDRTKYTLTVVVEDRKLTSCEETVTISTRRLARSAAASDPRFRCIGETMSSHHRLRYMRRTPAPGRRLPLEDRRE
jgi:hypothetical protein